MAEAIRRAHAMVVLHALMVLRLRRVLVLSMLLEVVQHIGHPTARPIQPSIMPLLMVLGVHAVDEAHKLAAKNGEEVKELTGTGLGSRSRFSLQCRQWVE